MFIACKRRTTIVSTSRICVSATPTRSVGTTIAIPKGSYQALHPASVFGVVTLTHTARRTSGDEYVNVWCSTRTQDSYTGYTAARSHGSDLRDVKVYTLFKEILTLGQEPPERRRAAPSVHAWLKQPPVPRPVNVDAIAQL